MVDLEFLTLKFRLPGFGGRDDLLREISLDLLGVLLNSSLFSLFLIDYRRWLLSGLDLPREVAGFFSVNRRIVRLNEGVCCGDDLHSGVIISLDGRLGLWLLHYDDAVTLGLLAIAADVDDGVLMVALDFYIRFILFDRRQLLLFLVHVEAEASDLNRESGEALTRSARCTCSRLMRTGLF